MKELVINGGVLTSKTLQSVFSSVELYGIHARLHALKRKKIIGKSTLPRDRRVKIYFLIDLEYGLSLFKHSR